MPPIDKNHPILLFDGICNYCNGWVNFIIRHDKKKKFRFTALQSDAAKKLLHDYRVSSNEDSVVLIDNDKAYLKSSAALGIMKHLGGLSPFGIGIYILFFLLAIIPPFIRNFFYDIIANNRYKWWGKRDRCMIPNEEAKERFL